MRAILLLICAVACACQNTQPDASVPLVAAKIKVDISDKRLVAQCEDGDVLLDVPCETSRVGVGHKKYSKRTPVGSYTIAKLEPEHRYGNALRLNGYQGFQRGILFHPNLDGKPHGTNGCICPLYDEDMVTLFALARVGTQVEITR